LPVSATIEAMTLRVPRGTLDRTHTAQGSEGRLTGEPVGVIADGNQQSGSVVRPYPIQIEQFGRNKP
jgi:hypothetical protein